MRKRIAAVLAVASVAVGMSVGSAGASITPGQPASCTNGGGQQPPGQQPNCNNDGGLDQNPATPATNPAGHAPPGQQ
jgi:hypothetical protein